MPVSRGMFRVLFPCGVPVVRLPVSRLRVMFPYQIPVLQVPFPCPVPVVRLTVSCFSVLPCPFPFPCPVPCPAPSRDFHVMCPCLSPCPIPLSNYYALFPFPAPMPCLMFHCLVPTHILFLCPDTMFSVQDNGSSARISHRQVESQMPTF